MRPRGDPGDISVSFAGDARCGGPERGGPLLRLEGLIQPQRSGNEPVGEAIERRHREGLGRRDPDGGSARRGTGSAAGERRPRTRAARRARARCRARRRRLAPDPDIAAETEHRVMDRRPVHPMAWIVWATSAGFVAFVTTDPVYLLLLWAVSWFVYAGHRVDAEHARSFRLFLTGAMVAVALRTALVFFGTVSAANTTFSFLEGLRLGTILVIFGTFNAVTDPFGLVRMAPRHFHEPALAAALALSIAPRTVAGVGRVRDAQRMRGIRIHGARALPALAVPVLERGMAEAHTLDESMDARGHGAGRRSRYRPQPWTGAAILIAVPAIAAAATFLAASVGGWAVLHPQTSPIVWPEADPLLLAGIGLLTVPGVVGRPER